jgi:hypothetical protein
MILYSVVVYNTGRSGGEVSGVEKDERKPPKKPIPSGPKPKA